MQFIDTHIHLDELESIDSEISKATALGVTRFIVPGTRIARWPQLMQTVAQWPQALAAPGIHPLDAEHWHAQLNSQLSHLLASPQAVALGEVGLDRQASAPWSTQETVFREMIRIACETGKPLLIHNRGATGRILEILREERADRVGGIMHAFSGSLETAQQAADLGFAIGVSGVVTYPEARRLPDVVVRLAAEWLVLETDAPDLAPEPHRGAPNHAAYLPLIATRVAALRGWSLAETARITTANASRVLNLSDAAAVHEP